jgi:lysophospholipase L1-like esterase
MDKKIKIFIAGDSTAATKKDEARPETGWGEKLADFFSEAVTVRNFAFNGRSSRSFIEEGLLALILKEIDKNDFLFIQFGHNDSKEQTEKYTDPYTSYQVMLTVYIEKARELSAQPVLLTPIQRRKFNEDGTLSETHGEYPSAMRELAARLSVPLIDMSAISRILLEQLGPVRSKELFLWLEPGEAVHYPRGSQDDTHFSDFGATEMARLVAGEIQRLKLMPLYREIIK